MEEKVTTFLTEDRSDEVIHSQSTKEQFDLVVDYLLIDYKKTKMTNNFRLNLPTGQEIPQKEAMANRYIFLCFPGSKLMANLTNPREVRYVYLIAQDVTVEKFRNNRKVESVKLTFDQIRQSIQAFQSHTGAFLKEFSKFDSNQFMAPLLPQEELLNRKKVQVKGGQLAYAALERKNRPAFRNYNAEEVSRHNKRDDAWTVLNGKVYDITMYMEYHPGGVEKLMLGAGKDCTKLFNQFHGWVNGHAFLEKDYIGNLKN